MEENNNNYDVFDIKNAGEISLLKYSKSSCGVDFLLNTADSHEKRSWFDSKKQYKTDFYEFYFFRKAKGFLFLTGKKIELKNEMLLIISPFQQQEWHVDIDDLDYTFLVFQEEFINNFLSDKYFMFRLLYCYQNHYPTYLNISINKMKPFLDLLHNMKNELRNPLADSYHMIVAYLYQFLLKVNRLYADMFNLPFLPPQNNYAYQYKQLLEKFVGMKNRVNDYADMMNVSRISLNKAVESEFGVTASQLLKQRLLVEIKNDLLFTDYNIKEIAYRLNFSEPQHLMRFFKQQTQQTITQFINEYRKEHD